jgi:hypothetical protein
VKRPPRHASLEPSSDRTSSPPLWPMCRPSSGVASLRRWSSRDADGPIGRQDCHLERLQTMLGSGSERVCARRSRHADCFPCRQRYQRAKALSHRGRAKAAYSKRELYYRSQVRCLQRDVQLTGPLALEEVHRDGGGGVAAMATAGRWQGRCFKMVCYVLLSMCMLRRELNDAAVNLHRVSIPV